MLRSIPSSDVLRYVFPGIENKSSPLGSITLMIFASLSISAISDTLPVSSIRSNICLISSTYSSLKSFGFSNASSSPTSTYFFITFSFMY